jgi:hypothetical protein
LEGSGDFADFLESLTAQSAALEMVLHQNALCGRQLPVMVTTQATLDLPAIEHYSVPPHLQTPLKTGEKAKSLAGKREFF